MQSEFKFGEETLGDWIAKFCVSRAWWLLCTAGFVVLAAIFPATMLRVGWQVESMFSSTDPALADFRDFRQRFGANEVILVVYRDEELWDASGHGLDRVTEVSQRLSMVPGIEAVLSLAELHEILQKLRGPVSSFWGGEKPKATPLLDPDDKLAQAFFDVFEGMTHRRDSQYVAIACLVKSERNSTRERFVSVSHRETAAGLRQVIADPSLGLESAFITGEPVLVLECIRLLRRDGFFLNATTTFLISLVLMALFRSWRWAVVPLVLVYWSLIVTRAALLLCGFQLSLVSSTLSAMLTVVGVATVIHLLLRFHRERMLGKSSSEAAYISYRELMPAVVWACVTDAIGFLALVLAPVGPIQEFGSMMAIGMSIILVGILIVTPGLIRLLLANVQPKPIILDVQVRGGLRALLSWSLKYRVMLLLSLVFAFAIAVVGTFRLQVETDFTKNFASDSEIVETYRIVERELGGAGVWDIMVPAPTRLTSEYMQQLLELEDKLRGLVVSDGVERIGLTKVLSVADALQATQSGLVLSALPLSARMEGMRQTMPAFTNSLMTLAVNDEEVSWLRIMLRSHEIGTVESKSQLIAQVNETLQEHTALPSWKSCFEHDPPPARVTGMHVMLSKVVSSILEGQWLCFLVATIGIVLVVWLASMSLRLALIALIPNVFPIVLVLGGMGWLGWPVNMGAAMIAAVSIGLSIDSSIHYILHYQKEVRLGNESVSTLFAVQENVGTAVLLASVALIVGFVSLTASEFVPTVVFGSLASLTILGGLLGNLVLLPILIAVTEPQRS